MILLTLLLAATVAASPTAQPSTPVATTTAPPASTATATLPPRAAVPPAAPPMASLPSSVIPSIQSHPTTVISSSSATVTTSRLPSSTSTATATQVTRAATIVSSSPAPSTIGGGAWTTEQLASLAPPAHLPTLLEERLDTLACDISLPPNAKIWRANQTEELLLPIQGEPVTDSNAWSGTAVVQTGDVLLVKIDDSALEAAAKNRTRRPAMELDSDGQHRRRQPDFSVYQVTRLGYENCDATEGVLLDITPLQVDNRQVVTLYDKDLTEGINLLIVVSTKWLEERCVRLRVVVKADNCGDAQDCSAKGVCFTNGSMEGYECQCCAGFVGAHCEEQDACYPSPCENHGICVDISQGHEGTTFQCLCPYETMAQWVYIRNNDELFSYLQGRDDDILIARGTHNGNDLPGYARVSEGLVYFAYFQEVITKTEFHVLEFGENFSWQFRSFRDPIPGNAFVAGYNKDADTPLYLGRLEVYGETLYGYVNEQVLEIATRTRVLLERSFDILVINWERINERKIEAWSENLDLKCFEF